jgi:hypothetical protein
MLPLPLMESIATSRRNLGDTMKIARVFAVSLSLLALAATASPAAECMTKCRTDLSQCQRTAQATRRTCLEPCRAIQQKLGGCRSNADAEECPGIEEARECGTACGRKHREQARTCMEAARTCRSDCMKSAAPADTPPATTPSTPE